MKRFLRFMGVGVLSTAGLAFVCMPISSVSAEINFTVPANQFQGAWFRNSRTRDITCDFSATGQWTGGVEYYGPDGFTTIAGPDYPLAGVAQGALIARRVSQNGQVRYQYVGSGTTISLRSKESIYFLMNDRRDWFANNQGSLNISANCQ